MVSKKGSEENSEKFHNNKKKFDNFWMINSDLKIRNKNYIIKLNHRNKKFSNYYYWTASSMKPSKKSSNLFAKMNYFKFKPPTNKCVESG